MNTSSANEMIYWPRVASLEHTCSSSAVITAPGGASVKQNGFLSLICMFVKK